MLSILIYLFSYSQEQLIMNSKLDYVSWIIRIVAAGILFQTLYFKFGAEPQSVAIFTKLGIEPWGRIGSGVIELIAGILILIPKTRIYGALAGMAIMSGAFLSHLTKLGIEVNGDGGTLFILAIVVFILCLATVIIHKNELPFFGKALD